MELPRKNSEHTMVITGYSSMGEGVGHLESGLTVFVRDALRGERCRISILKASERCAWGRLLAVEEPSPARVAPDCPYYPKCGGCQLRHMSYEEELSLKLGRVNDALQRIGGLSLRAEVIHPAPERTGYRNKVQFPVGPAPDGGVRLGFYRRRSHEIVPVERCLLQPEASNRAGQIVRRWMDERQIAPYDENSHTGLVRHLFCRTNAAGELLVCLVVNAGALPEEGELVRRLRAGLPELAGVVLSENRERTNVVLGRSFRTLWGRDWLEDTLCGLTFRLSVPSFFQVNRRQAEVLYRRALDFAGLTGRETVLDLYCGTGTITLVMAQRARRVIGAEIVPEAIEDAKANARRNGLENASFLCADAGQAAEMLAEQGIRPDVISVDPPRKGLSHEVIEAICQMAPERVVYVSCDPGTLARDLALLDGRNYRADRVEVVDLFPGTRHVETVVKLGRKQIDGYVEVDLDVSLLQSYAVGPATYAQIKDYVKAQTGLSVSTLYIAQVKRKFGIRERENYNLPKSGSAKTPQCPPEKERAIVDALRHFHMIE